MVAMKRGLLVAILLFTSACSHDDTLQGAFEKNMKDNGVAGFDLIHMQENVQDGLVLFASWTSDYPENRDEPAIYYFQKLEGLWVQQTGTACGSSGISTLGLLGNGYLYCATLREDMNFERVQVGDSEAMMFQTNGGLDVWYVVADSKDLKVAGISSDGRDVPLN